MYSCPLETTPMTPRHGGCRRGHPNFPRRQDQPRKAVTLLVERAPASAVLLHDAANKRFTVGLIPAFVVNEGDIPRRYHW